MRRAYNEDIGDERGTGWWTATDEIVESSQAYIEEGDIGGQVFPLYKEIGRGAGVQHAVVVRDQMISFCDEELGEDMETLTDDQLDIKAEERSS